MGACVATWAGCHVRSGHFLIHYGFSRPWSIQKATNQWGEFAFHWLVNCGAWLANIGGVVKPASGAEYNSFDETLPLIG